VLNALVSLRKSNFELRGFIPVVVDRIDLNPVIQFQLSLTLTITSQMGKGN
jgi:hypothetical protein